MKRWIALLLTLVVAFGLVGCSSKDDDWQKQYDLGVRYLTEGEYEEAILAFAAAIEIDPKRPEAYVGRGDAYRQLGDLASAEQDYQTAWELDPGNTETGGKLADALIDQGKLEEAADILEDLIEKDPTNPDHYDKLADVYEQLGQTDKAQEVLEEGIAQTGDEGLADRLEQLANGGLPAVPDDGIQREVREISSGEELVELSYTSGLSNLELHLGDGDYNVAGLMFMSADNVSIIGTGKTRLIATDGTETILSLYDCDNFLIYGLVMGHDLEPMMGCSTGVVELLSSSGAKIVGCDIFGCGLQGISADHSDFTVEHSTIRDCSEHGAIFFSSRGVFNDCTFSGNCYKTTGNPVFQMWDGDCEITLNDCTLADNPAQSKYAMSDSGSEWNENNSAESGNGWQ